MNNNNHKRILAEVLSLDAWHDPFEISSDTYGVYAELSFSEGRLGGDDTEVPFTFNLSVKKALMTIKLGGPISIDKQSVARHIPEKQTEYQSIRKAKTASHKTRGIRADAKAGLVPLSLSGDLSNVTESEKEQELKIIQTIPEILVTPKPGGSAKYSWEMEPLLKPNLKGQPWDPVDPPRFRIKTSENMITDYSINVEVRCALEDLLITEIRPKSQNLLEKMSLLPRREINEAAAIQHLKKLLVDVDLYPNAMDNRFNSVILADVLALSL